MDPSAAAESNLYSLDLSNPSHANADEAAVHKDPNQEDDKIASTKEGPTLGPSPELWNGRYPLTLRGDVDKLYQKPTMSPFEFNQEVVSVFDDMVSRSVPLYHQVIDLAIDWVHQYYKPGTAIVDLGCSTGTTLEVFIRSFGFTPVTTTTTGPCSHRIDSLHVVGVDNSPAMIQACQEKLHPYDCKSKSVKDNVQEDSSSSSSLSSHKIQIDLFCQDILSFSIPKASFVIMNYTLQFIPVAQRLTLLHSIYCSLESNGILFLSEKVRAESLQVQETCTTIYEDFKRRNHYTDKEIERKKEALMNVLIPYTEQELRQVLVMAGFQPCNIEIVAKWNNFTTLIARKTLIGNPFHSEETMSGQPPLYPPLSTFASMNLTNTQQSNTPHLDRLVFESVYPHHLVGLLSQENLRSLSIHRLEAFHQKGHLSLDTLATYDEIAYSILSIPPITSKKFIVNDPILCIGDAEELTLEQQAIWYDCAVQLRPWKKGPLNLFGVEIDTEWRSDWKWARIQPHLPSLKDKVICDLGCGNGYFMFRMLEYQPKMVMGIDPNLHALIEFHIFKRFSGVENLYFEFLRADCLTVFPGVFDVLFCLGVLYHTPDPIGMLRDIWSSMKSGAVLIVDCQGIPGEEHVAFFPQKRYANMKGVYFLPTLETLKIWIRRANFVDTKVIFSEPLSVHEQRITEWAPVHTSFNESLDPFDPTKTIEGYPSPHRFYVKCRKA